MKHSDVFHKLDERQNQEIVQHVVRSGETLYNIARQYGVSVNDLVSANSLTSSLIYPNQIIVIPQREKYGSVYFEEYVIQTNDTLESIADSVGVMVDDIMKYNDISKLILLEDQIIYIPRSYKHYTVQPDDTIESILTNTGMTATELLLANKDSWLAPGTTINVY